MMAERGVAVDHATVHRWALKILPILAPTALRQTGERQAVSTAAHNGEILATSKPRPKKLLITKGRTVRAYAELWHAAG